MQQEVKLTQSDAYQFLNKWLRDGNLTSEYPKELEGTRLINGVFFLNYFESSQKYFPFINKLFNNFGLFELKVKELAILLKEMLYYTGFKQPFIKRTKKSDNNKLVSILKKKYPYYKHEEVLMAVDIIDNSAEKDIIYEMFGLYSIKTKKLTKKEQKEQRDFLNNMISKDDLLDDM